MEDLGDWSVVEKDVDAEGRSDCAANDVALFREGAGAHSLEAGVSLPAFQYYPVKETHRRVLFIYIL